MSRIGNFKTFLISSKIEQRFTHIFENEIDEKTAIRKIKSMSSKFCVTLSANVEDYIGGHINKKKVIVSILLKIILLINGLRYLMSATFPSKRMRCLLSDANYLLTNSQIL